MLLAKQNEIFIEAHPDMRALCPQCGNEVISKCGTIKIWHWAHKVECPYHTEPETEWHLQWKIWAKERGFNVEVRRNNHIFDAFNPVTKTVFEFQHSPISQKELSERSFDAVNSGYLINWIFDYKKKHIEYHHPAELLREYNKDVSLKLQWYNRRYAALLQGNTPMFGKIYLDVRQFWNYCDLLEVRILKYNGKLRCNFVSINDVWGAHE